MALCKRIIPCLDIADNRVVKGVHFQHLRDVGDPVELAMEYERQGADELTILDINASHENRGNFVELVSRIAQHVFIPLTVGGGIRSLEDMHRLLKAGADKVSVNTAAVRQPSLIDDAAREFGAQFFVLSLDTKKAHGEWHITTVGAREQNPRPALDWAREAADRGAGEILLNVVDSDGTQRGYALDITAAVAEAVRVPVIASGGAGAIEHVYDVLDRGRADAALVASLVHIRHCTVGEIKQYLHQHGVHVRL